MDKTGSMIDTGAHILRETTETTYLKDTVRSAVSTPANHDIPHLIVGGLAVLEYGYYRVTLDVDIVVPDIWEAVEVLTADLSSPFIRLPDCEDSVRDRRSGVIVNLFPAGRV